MDMSEKKQKNACSICFWQKMNGGKDTGQKYQCDIFIFVDLCSGVVSAFCGQPQPEHESMMPLLSLSPLNV